MRQCRTANRRRLLARLLMWLNGVFPHFMSVRSTPLRLAFLGCGYITRVHSAHLPALKGLIVPSYASRDKAKAEEYRRRFGGAVSYGDYESAIADPAVDAVAIAVP